ncbi:MAG: CUAEP/CCAEP-tail radical SAM protein [Burkholderiales bacterium]|nr:CUAEP/CCAEP-tail radical SAM protein [Burkholderiales bacterium]
MDSGGDSRLIEGAGAEQQSGAPGRFEVVLINPYELGRQPFALAEPAAWLKRDGFEVHCIDLSLQQLDPAVLAGAQLVALYVGMHTATRIAVEALPRIRALAPLAHLCVYGLYAPMNQELLRGLGVKTILGGEFEPALAGLARRLRAGEDCDTQAGPVVNLARINFLTPERSGLPELARYAHLLMPDGGKKQLGFIEASRGCKHLCRHCPVVPVYQGKFRVVPVPVVMADIAQQVEAGAAHISFGDPDFFNGSTHAMKVLAAMHAKFPGLSFDATIKIQHIIAHADLLPALKAAGCLFITAAVESVDAQVLQHLAKNHTPADFERALQLCRDAGIAMAPTFVPFTPWTSLESYLDLLRTLLRLRLVEAVPPIQLCIRLLVPEGSWLLRLPGFGEMIEAFDPKLLGYPWRHADARVDRLQQALQTLAAQGDRDGLPRSEIFAQMWGLAHDALGLQAPLLTAADFGVPVAHLSEPWYCCAEPTEQQLRSF